MAQGDRPAFPERRATVTPGQETRHRDMPSRENLSPGRPLPLAAAAAWVTLAGACGLMLIGGLVTTHGAGMAVPDWPLSFGEVNPPGWWDLFEVRLEHGHRLAGAAVGVLTILLVLAVFASTRRRAAKTGVFRAVTARGDKEDGCKAGPSEKERAALRRMALALLGLVIFQGVLGGLRVLAVSLDLAVVHAVFAQIFFALLFVFAARLSLGSAEWRGAGIQPPGGFVRAGLQALPLLLLAQLVIAAVMRHHKAGMAIVDFPLHFGRLIPPLDTFPVAVHFAHRAMGWLIALVIFAVLIAALASPAARSARAWLWGMLALVVFQIALGARIVTGGRPPAETSFHLLTGALLLALSMAAFWRLARPRPRAQAARKEERETREAVAA